MSIDKRTLVELCDVTMKQKFKECDKILNKFRRATRNHILYMLDNYDTLVTYNKELDFWLVKNRYMVYRSKRLKYFNWSCQCTWRSYYDSICGHVAVIKIHSILTFSKDLIEHYLFYIEKKKYYRKLLRYRTPKFLSKC